MAGKVKKKKISRYFLWFFNFSYICQYYVFQDKITEKIILKKKKENTKRKKMKKFYTTAVTRIRTWVTAATTQGPNH